MKTLLFLNIQGSVLVILLLLLKKIIHRSFSGKAQRAMWAFAAVMFLLPIWKLVPAEKAVPIIIPYYDDSLIYEAVADISENDDRDFNTEEFSPIKIYDIVPLIWGSGAALFMLLSISSYMVFLFKKRRASNSVTDEVLENILPETDIKRKIRLRECTDNDSPMLTGVFFPVVYIPKNELNEAERGYIYRHELMHFLHKDLLLKWFVCFINAIHWFNPFMYIVMRNINEACEIYCDEEVTKDMDIASKRGYMNTILNLVGKKGENYV